MSDTPSPDIPDPASPTPVSPTPADPSAAKPRRVITRPDTMIAPRRQPGTVITRPEDAKGSRLPGTYAANYGREPSWKRGLFVLLLLFGLAGVAAFLRVLVIVWSSSRGLPLLPETGRLVEIGRIAGVAVLFSLLWTGWNLPRWLLATVVFFFGLFFVITVAAPLPTPPGAIPVLNGGRIVSAPQLALGVIYLVTAAYLIFSMDVISWARHRREAGRGWLILPVALVAGAYAFALGNVQPYYRQQFERWKPEAAQFATEGLSAMAQNWDVAAYDQRADPEYLKLWTADKRQPTFATLAGLGPATSALPEAKVTGEPRASVTRDGGSFQVSYTCDFGRVKFAHGSAAFGCIVSRSIRGVWHLQDLLVGDLENDPAPVPAVLAAAPAAPAAPLPTATASPVPAVPSTP